MYEKELTKLKSFMNADLWGLLQDQGCIIAGGAVTSMFTNKEVNDVDVYFPSKEAFTKVMQELIDLNYWHNYKYKKEYGLGYVDGMITIVTNKAVMLLSEGNRVQFIVHKFYQAAEEIFQDFDFTVCMGALEMKTDTWKLHEDFFKHNSQRFIQFNEKTSYPLISALRIAKYKDKGYNISKAQFMKVMMAVNAKNINSWEVLLEELGGMYGTAPEDIFDTSLPFDISYAMQKLDDVMITEKMQAQSWSNLDEIVKKIPHAFTEEIVKVVNKYEPIKHLGYSLFEIS